jgi:hypothetical protein
MLKFLHTEQAKLIHKVLIFMDFLVKFLTLKLAFALIYPLLAQAGYWSTLPKGVRLLEYRNISANNVSSSYSNTQRETPFNYSINLNSELLAELPEAKPYLDDLKSMSPAAYEAFSLGQHGINARADVNVQVTALGWGLTDRLTVYAGIPFYKANVNINYNKKSGNNYQEVARILHREGKGEMAGVYENVIENMVDFNAAFFQSILTEQYGYQPAGSWQGQGLGDIEVGMIYKLADLQYAGLATTLGFNLPTGRVEDPSIIQDISFGDGQTDIFLEVGGGVYLSDAILINSFVRYTHQMRGNRNLRVPTDENFLLSDQTDRFGFKLGDKIDYNVNVQYNQNDWLSFRTGYELYLQDESRFYSRHAKANEILANNTDTVSHNIRLATNLSTVKLFQKGKIPVPGSIDLSYLHMLSGRNVPKVNRFEVHFRMFF